MSKSIGKKRKHHLEVDVANGIRFLEQADELTLKDMPDVQPEPEPHRLTPWEVRKALYEIQAKSTVLLVESSNRLEKFTKILLFLTGILALLTVILIFKTA